MFEARYIAQDGTAQPLRVEEYDGGTHRGHTLCGDFRCAARVHYRQESRVKGDVLPRVPHFVTHRGEKHIENCTHHNADTEERALRNLRTALLRGQTILINLNMDAGVSLGDDFALAADPAKLDTPYGRFVRQGKHYAVSARSAADMLRLYNALQASGHADAVARTYVGHRHEIRKLENVVLAADSDKLQTLFNSLSRGEGVMMQGPQQRVTGFPRLIRFEPTEKTLQKGARTGKINGTPHYVAAWKAVLLQNLNLRDRSIRQDILQAAATYVLAAPTVDRAGAKDDKFRVISWAVHNEAQYQADPQARRKAQQLDLL